MADAFGGGEIVGEILVREPVERIAAREALEHGSVDVQRHRQRVALFRHQELLVAVARFAESLRAARDRS